MAPRPRLQLFFMAVLGIFWLQTPKSAVAADRPITAFVHAALIPMTSATVVPDQTVVVEGKRISAVGPSSQTPIPPQATLIDCANAFLMPGLADMHMHLRPHWMDGTWPVSPLKLYLANGVTCIRCFGPAGRNGRYALEWRSAIEAGSLKGPRILTCGPQLRGHFKTDPQRIVIGQKYSQFDFIKIYSYVTAQEYRAIMATAKKLKVYTAGHIPFQVGLAGVLAEGMDEIAHIEELLWELSDLDRQRHFANEADWLTYAIQTTFRRMGPLLELSPRDQEKRVDAMVAGITDRLKQRSTPVCTTLVIDDLIVQKLFHPQRFLERGRNRFLPAGYLDRFRKGLDKHQRQFKNKEGFARFKYLLLNEFVLLHINTIAR